MISLCERNILTRYYRGILSPATSPNAATASAQIDRIRRPTTNPAYAARMENMSVRVLVTSESYLGIRSMRRRSQNQIVNSAAQGSPRASRTIKTIGISRSPYHSARKGGYANSRDGLDNTPQ